ncbi:hypothetical protein SAMN05421749_103368 [Acinetobacter marinus]|uniref:Uncharacterized protein n=1 Tax=Acinetobacter marinus TaxID=281375 RepID=A0A1G6JJ68_9GAMM|nr:hypothetical protein [Acinetobacter marinus]SDC18717.1 hypothetical protein SAMN05421749_103368 [Acinetobacter marinus]
MSARAQLILKQLGISPWVERTAVTDIVSAQMLWRDQADVTQNELSITSQHLNQVVHPEQHDKSVAPKTVANTKKAQTNIQASTVQDISSQGIAVQAKVVQEAVSQELIAQEDVFQEANAQDSSIENQTDRTLEDEIEVVSTIQFHYQVLVHDAFLIFAQAENSAQHRLLQNIQKACQIRQAPIQLTWPLSIRHWQLGDVHVQDYIHGFLQAFAVEHILVLGQVEFELPKINQMAIQLEAHATLAELLESADAKRKLWMTIQSLMSTA